MAAAPIESLRSDTPLKPLYIIHGEEDLLRIELWIPCAQPQKTRLSQPRSLYRRKQF